MEVSNFEHAPPQWFTSLRSISHNRIYYPFSLPSIGLQIPLCKDELDRICYEQVLEDLRSSQEANCEKSCHVQEYGLEKVTFGLMKKVSKTYEEWDDWLSRNWNWEGRDKTKAFVLEYKFELPSDLKDHRSDRPFKKVHKEYLVTGFMLMVGNIGGTLGMFVGFSIMGLKEWCIKVFSWMNKNMN